MTTKKHYTINEETRTIEGNVSLMTESEQKTVMFLCSTGYVFKARQRDNHKRTKTYIQAEIYNKLINEDQAIFDDIAGNGDKGAYSSAASFGKGIIQLGKAQDKRPDVITDEVLDEFRLTFQDDKAKARLFLRKHLEMAA